MSKPEGFTINSHFENKEPVVRQIYDRLLKHAQRFGPVVEDPKQDFDSSEQRDRLCRCGDAEERDHPDSQERPRSRQSPHSQVGTDFSSPLSS